MSKRAQFYVIDAFFATIILLLGIGFLASGSSFTPQQTTARLLVADVTSTLMVPTISEFQNNYTNEYFDLLNQDFSVASQAQVWWHNASCDWCLANASALTSSVLTAVGSQHGVSVLLRNQTHNVTLFEQNTSASREPRFMIVNRQIVLTEVGGSFHGPDVLEVRVWQ